MYDEFFVTPIHHGRPPMSLLRTAVRPLYDAVVRPRLPQKIALCNDVAVRNAGLLDVTDIRPDYEEFLIDGIQRTVRKGDTVLVLGGGYGVSTVQAARAAGSSGTVHAFEASDSQVPVVEETVELNSPPADVTVHHAAIGDVSNFSIEMYGTAAEAADLQPNDLPECDVLVMDIEGTERAVLEKLEDRPRAIVAESHGDLGSPTEFVTSRLEEMGYGRVQVLGAENVKEDVCVVEAAGRE